MNPGEIQGALMDALVARYIALRDGRERATRTLRELLMPINEEMARIEAELLDRLHTQRVESARTDAGTVFQTRQVSVTLEDKEKFIEYIKQRGAWYLAEIRASKSAVQEMAQIEQEIPPGVKMTAVETVSIHRPKGPKHD